jgi:D-2-hydroxyacid dehydrogenase (NADP+)
LTGETEGLISAPALTALKPGALLINVARGRVIEEAELLAALADGRVRAAALDPFLDAAKRSDYAAYRRRNRALRKERR